MSSCERCWTDACRDPYASVVDRYHELLRERVGDQACTPEQQAGPDATECPICGRMACHQITGECMACQLFGHQIAVWPSLMTK